MAIALGCDHAGFDLKQHLISYFQQHHIEYLDVGCYSPERCDYPLYAVEAAKLVAEGRCEFGLVICGTGIGVSIAANKVKGIRAALCCNQEMAKLAREHNDANILALGGRTTSPQLAEKILETFLGTSFKGGRHRVRVELIHSITNK